MKKSLEYQQYNINIDSSLFNDAYLPHLETVKRYEVYYGGAGSGKSFFIAQKLALQMTMMEGRNLVVLRKQAVDCRDSAYPDLYNALSDFNLLQFWHIVEHPLVRMTNIINGNVILFNGIDDIENIKSIKFKRDKGNGEVSLGNLTDVWYEEASEETTSEAVEELDRRMRDPLRQSRIILSFNPVFVEHWLKKFIDDLLKSKKSYSVLKTTYKDNRFLPKEYISVLEEYRMTNPYAYQVYALGNWGTMGQSIFDVNKVSSRLETLYNWEGRYIRNVEMSFERGDKEKIIAKTCQPFDYPDGDVVIYAEPKENIPYVLSIDPSGEGSDFWAGQVINNVTGEQVAVFHSLREPPFCVNQLVSLGYYYNTALIAPEVNFGEYTVEKLKEYEYPNIYQRNKPIDGFDTGNEMKLGFRTTSENRTRMLYKMVEYVGKNVDTINDVQTLQEMLSFTRQAKKMKGLWMGASPGAHDDLVMAYAIALEAREQQDSQPTATRKEVTGFWYPEVLASMVRTGKMLEDDARDYMRRNKDRLAPLVKDVEEYDFYA